MNEVLYISDICQETNNLWSEVGGGLLREVVLRKGFTDQIQKNNSSLLNTLPQTLVIVDIAPAWSVGYRQGGRV